MPRLQLALKTLTLLTNLTLDYLSKNNNNKKKNTHSAPVSTTSYAHGAIIFNWRGGGQGHQWGEGVGHTWRPSAPRQRNVEL